MRGGGMLLETIQCFRLHWIKQWFYLSEVGRWCGGYREENYGILLVEFEDFNSPTVFTVFEMDERYDLILGIPWLDKPEPWIDWRSRTIGGGSFGVGKTFGSNDS
ncbi:putative aspartic peptidase domain superfamily [Plasmopara halstedii]